LDDPFHWPVLGTTAKEGCSLRTVILRQVNAPDRILVCHTDARSAKVQEILNCSQASWIFYHPKKKIQVRISGHATLHVYDPAADRQWADTSVRLDYPMPVFYFRPKFKIQFENYRDAKNDVPMRNRFNNIAAKPLTELHHPFLMTRRTEMAALAGKCQ